MNKPEILAPAGNRNALLSAVSGGCNAVYLGAKKFSARSGANNFDLVELRWAINYSHLFNVKVYLAINTMVKENEVDDLISLVREAVIMGVDAFIVQDFGVLNIIRQIAPDILIHSSTQMNIHSVYGALFAKKVGINRLILARELSLKEIKLIKEESELEIETFVHGALCYCYSGQCLLSSSLGSRSANRGACAQPCRLKYNVNDKSNYIMSLKDLSALSMLKEIVDAGVGSLKIEGRVKSEYYVYKVVSLYRKYVDKLISGERVKISEEDLSDILQVYNRGEFTSGFYKTHNDKNLVGRDRPKHRGIVVGVSVSNRKKETIVKLDKSIKKGDNLEYKLGSKSFRFYADSDYDNELLIKQKINIGTPVFRLTSAQLNKEIDKKVKVIRTDIDIEIYLTIDESAKMIIYRGNKQFIVYGDTVQKAKKAPLLEKDIIEKISKTGELPFTIRKVKVYMDDDIFMPVSKLNELRREALNTVFEGGNTNHKVVPFSKKSAKNTSTTKRNINVKINTVKQFKALLDYDINIVYIDALSVTSSEIEDMKRTMTSSKIYGVVPKIVRSEFSNELRNIKSKLDLFDGLLIKSIDSLEYTSDLDKKIGIDYSLNVANNYAVDFFSSLGAKTITPSLEITYKELGDLNTENLEYLVYGHIITMTSASCIKKTSDRCIKSNGSLYFFKDRKGEQVYYQTKCTLCYNEIYNPYPLYLIDKIKELQKIGVGNYRLDFTYEKVEEIKGILDEVFYGNKTTSKKYSRGHYVGGVE